MGSETRPAVEILSTCPPANDLGSPAYRDEVARVAGWSEAAGCGGILVYSDNRLTDPWLVAQLVLASTARLRPLVAVQPVYMHPFSVARMVASLACLYGRGVDLNLVAGGFRNDLVALDDPTPHDRRYDRLVEYATIVKALLQGDGPVTFEGEFYRVRQLKLSRTLPAELVSEVYVSGSSEAGRAAARALSAIAVRYPQPVADGVEEGVGDLPSRCGVRLGIVAREEDDDAWKVAHERFPSDRRGQLARQLATKVSDSEWHRRLSETDGQGPYWLVPFENYKTMCPYLVGSYRRVGRELGRHIEQGARSFILDVPWTEDDLWHARAAFDAGLERRAG